MPSPCLTLSEAATLVSGSLSSDDSQMLISGVQTLESASPQQAAFLANMKYKHDLLSTKAGVVLISEEVVLPEGLKIALIRLKNPYVGFALLQRFFAPDPQSSGMIHPSAVIDPSAHVAADVQVDALVVIGANAQIGSGSIIGAGCMIGEDVRIGEHCLLHPRVVLERSVALGNRVIVQAGAVVGADGFGFAWTGSEFLKIPQTGSVVIGDDVEIGANTCIDRGAIENTIIKRGVKLDNMVQIGHNVVIGEHVVMAGQVGISGSTIIGRGCQFGGQSGVAGHLHLADGTVVSAKAGVIGNTKQSGMVSGFPAVPHRQWLRASGIFDRLPEIWNKIKRLG